MAEKKLSVRYSLEGAQEMRAGLKAIGEEGAAAAAKIGTSTEGSERALAKLDQRLGTLERSLDPVARAAARVQTALSLQSQAIAAGATDIERYAAVVRKAEASHATAAQALARSQALTAQGATAAGNAIRLQGYQITNLGHQLQDVAVQLAGGASPFLVLAQQGPQAAAAVGGVGVAFTLLANAIRANPIATAVAAAAAAAGAYLALRTATEEAKIEHEAYAEAVKEAAEADLTAAESAERLAAARRSEGSYAVRRAEVEQEVNLKILETRRALIRSYLDAAQAMPEGSAARSMALGPLGRELAVVEKQIADVTMRMGQLQAAAKQVSSIGLVGPDAGQAAKDYAKHVDDLARALDGLRGALDPVAKAEIEYRKAIDLVNEGVLRGQVSAKEELKLRAEAEERRDEAIRKAREEAEGLKIRNELNEDFQRRLQRLQDAEAKRQNSLDAYIASLEAEAQATALSNTERKVAEATRQAETKLLDELGRKTRDLTEAERGRIRVAIENRDATERATEAARRYAEEVDRIVKRATDRVTDFAADAIFDRLEGRNQDFWRTFEQLGKRAIAQVAAEAILRPIIIQPIVQSIVGGAPGLFGLTGSPGQAGGILGGNPLTSILGGLRNLFSPDNFIANLFPGLFGPGLTGGAAIAAGLTGPGGLALGGGAASSLAVGTTAGPLAGLAPFLPALAFALPLLFSAFGGKKSVGPNANAIINFERDAEGVLTNPGGLAIGGLGADNGGDRGFARSMAEAATKGFNAIVDRVGGRFTGIPGAGVSGQLELGYFQEGNRFFSVVGGEKAEFESAEKAVADFIKRALREGTIEGLSADVRTAIQRTTATSAEDLGRDIDFAHGFRRQVELAAAGPGTRAAQQLGWRYAGQDAAQALRLGNRDFMADALRLFGADSTQYAEARSTVLNRTLGAIGLGPDATGANAPLEGRAAALAESEARIREYRETLIAAGLTAAEADTKIAEAIAKADTEINKAFDWLDDLEELQAGAGALSVEIARWGYEAAEASRAIEAAQQKVVDTKQDYVDALQREIAVQQQAADGYGRLAESLKKGRLGLLIDGNLSPLSPGARLAEANAQFDAIYARAQAGDLKAGEQLYDVGRALLEAERAYSASSPAYVATFDKVQAALANTETIAERHARTANEQLTTLKTTLAELQGQGVNLKTVAEAAEDYREAQRRLGTVGGGAAARGEQQFQAFSTLASRFQTLYAGATTQAAKDQVYATAAAQRDALIGAMDAPTLQRVLQTFYRDNPDEAGANEIRRRLYGLGVVPAFGEGGIVDRPTMAWIAERGQAEAVVPLSHNRKIPVEMLTPANDTGDDGLVRELRAVRQALGDVAALLSRNGSAHKESLDGLRADFGRLSSRLVEIEARSSPNRHHRKTG